MLVFKQFGVLCVGLFASLLSSINLDVPLIYQYPEFPTGCESVATVEVLQYLGYDISVDEFIDNYVDTIEPSQINLGDFDNIFNHYFVGNPRSSSGWLCNPPVMISAVSKYFSEINETSRSPLDLTGTSFDFLLDELAEGHPVVIWMTIGYVNPTEKSNWGSTRYTPSHTVVLTGYNSSENTISIVDSIDGYVTLSYNRAKYLYDNTGKKCFVIK